MSNPEDHIHAGILQYVRLYHPDCLAFHPANGGLRNKREAAKLKWLGVLAGIPDIVILRPTGRVALMEVKAAKGVLTENQIAIRDHCERFEIPWACVRSIDDARAFLQHVDCALILARADQTRYGDFDSCEREVGEYTNVLGVVLNGYRYGDGLVDAERGTG